MKVLSVNISGPKPLNYRGQTVVTGIFKTPVASEFTKDVQVVAICDHLFIPAIRQHQNRCNRDDGTPARSLLR